jgi:hypothetical protein
MLRSDVDMDAALVGRMMTHWRYHNQHPNLEWLRNAPEPPYRAAFVDGTEPQGTRLMPATPWCLFLDFRCTHAGPNQTTVHNSSA